MKKYLWHNLTVKEIFHLLQTSPEGLDQEEVNSRLKKFGPNRLPEEKRLSGFEIFLEQFKNPLVYLLLFAGIVSFFLKEFIDAGVIFAAVLINAMVGFFQEKKAEEAIFHLRKLIQYKTRVLRKGQEKELLREELVPGDIVLLEAGDKVPADIRLFEIKDFQTNEASLTGESSPQRKITEGLAKGTILAERRNMAFMGTVVVTGKAKGVVVETGKNTHFGEIAQLVKRVEKEKTPLQLQLAHLSKLLTVFLGGISLFILILGILKGYDFFDIFITAIAVAVAAIPEGLLVAVTIILAIGVSRILKKKALVRKLIAVETLGSVTKICTDKTGTITLGEMRVSSIIAGGKEITHYEAKKLKLEDIARPHLFALQIAVLCNNAVLENPEE
ncbi:MAG TPA: hypothetical protein EYH54_06270, partial [Nautiliaceae bacterium]|nr:hypothetical protein [Nautiliaceae bacterium]